MSVRECEACGASGAEFRWNVRGYEIARCRDCDLLFVANPPSSAELRRIYDEGFFTVGWKFDDPFDSGGGRCRNVEARLSWIGRPPGRMLDVGCATGDFLVAARELGWTTYGIEWSAFAAERARSRGIDVHAGSLTDLDEAVGSFDVVTMWDYLEHVPSPLDHLRRARALLRPGGTLLLSTGDAASFFARVCGIRWHLLIPPIHLFFFGRRNLPRLLGRAGLSLQWMRWPGKYVNLGFLAAKGATLFPCAPTRGLSATVHRSGIGRRDLYLNFRDIVTIASGRS